MQCLKALDKINSYFIDSEESYFDFLKTKVKFWHFKTEKTDQGEELYITMNSRGKQLEDNETIRAKLFEQISKGDELSWSEEWEEWQDFFWRNRALDIPENSSDQGFNEFLKCISGFEAFICNSQEFIEVDDPIYSSKTIKFLSLEKIKLYFSSFTFLIDNVGSFKQKYQYSSWLDDCMRFIQELIFKTNTNWFVDYDDDLRAKERRHMVFMWSLFHYLNAIENKEEQIDNIYRVLRIYWLRYNNHDRSVKSIIERCNYFIEKGVWCHSITDDEKARHNFLLSKEKESVVRLFESAIWELEDHPLNLNGYQVQNQNITHLIDFSIELKLSDIEDITRRFNSLFVKDKPIGSKKLSTILLYYGFYAMQRRPYYYDNWDFSSWRRIVRDIDAKEPKVFKSFFNDFHGGNLKELLKTKKKEFLKSKEDVIKNSDSVIECDTLIDCLRFYGLVANDLWTKGRSIAELEYSPYANLTSYESRALFNTKGDFRGYGHIEFYELIDKPVEDIILDMKKMLKEC